MKVFVYPTDTAGCGHFRLIWPAQVLAAQGHDVTVIDPASRMFNLVLDRQNDRPISVNMPDCDVFVTQRLSHKYLAAAVPLIRARGTAVVIAMDDNLDEVSPRNLARALYHPARALGVDQGHHADNIRQACRDATMVTTSTPALAEHYGAPGRVRVLPNYLPGIYYPAPERVDHADIWWPATVDTHPDDPGVCGNAVERVVASHPHVRFRSIVVAHNAEICGQAFQLRYPVSPVPPANVMGWPALVAQAGIGIAPLEKGIFNAGKSALKPLEMMSQGVPYVASPSVEYRRLHKHTKVGLLASTPAEWFDLLDRLVREPNLRADQSAAGVAAAVKYRFEDHAWRWWQAWTDAMLLQRRVHYQGRPPGHLAAKVSPSAPAWAASSGRRIVQ